ncbi:MAG: hypothetical protein RLZ62_207 [Bacteroidota bacterium]
MATDTFFDEFQPVSKADWLAQVARDLKDRQPESLDWQSPLGFPVSPLVHADDFADEFGFTPVESEPNNWEVVEGVFAADPVAANRVSLDALEGGAEGLSVYLTSSPDGQFFSQLLEGIYPDYIGLHFTGPGAQSNPGAILGALQQVTSSRGIDSHALRGSIAFNPLAYERPDWRYMADLITFASETFPHFRLIELPVGSDGTAASELSAMIQRADTCFRELSSRGISVEKVAGTTSVSIGVGTSYFAEIARIRALKILWLNLVEAWNSPLILPEISATTHAGAYTDELYTNMIRSATIAMSAVIGGADRLQISPYDEYRSEKSSYPPAFGKRIARNVQHLLKMECHLNEVTDPSSGSYYIEKLTAMIAEAAWSKKV